MLPQAERSISLLDEGYSLALRSRAARLRAGNAGWWRRQFREVISTSDAMLVLCNFFVSSGPTVIASEIEVADDLLSRLDAGDVSRLSEILRDVVAPLASFGARGRVDVSAMPDSLSPVVVSLLGSVMPRRVRVELGDRFLVDYAGDHELALKFSLSMAVDAIRGSRDQVDRRLWETVKGLATRLGEESRVEIVRLAERTVRNQLTFYDLPVDLARSIVRNSSTPESLLVLAERVCEADTFERAESLAAVAQRAGWFASL
jgi:hypothetical protein